MVGTVLGPGEMVSTKSWGPNSNCSPGPSKSKRLQSPMIVNNYEKVINVAIMELYPQRRRFYIDTHAGKEV